MGRLIVQIGRPFAYCVTSPHLFITWCAGVAAREEMT
jgi:hypothetical protein